MHQHQLFTPNFYGMQPTLGLSLPEKVAHFLSYSGIIINLISQITAHVWAHGWDQCGDYFESRVLEFGAQSHLQTEKVWRSAGAEESVTALGRYGNWHLQQAVVFTFAGCIVAVLWAALDELDAHFVVFKLHQKPEEQNTLNIKLHHEGRWNNLTMKLE